MDEENKQEQQNDAEAKPTDAEASGAHQHVRIFGAEMASGSGGRMSDADRAAKKEEWRKRKEAWKQKHRGHIEENREQWRAQRHEWRSERYHGGGLFWGLIILFVGVIGLLYTMGFISHAFWYAIEPFWPMLLILWGASLMLGRHWFARFILFLLTLALLVIVIIYGLVRADSPLVSSLPPNVVSAVANTNPSQ